MAKKKQGSKAGVVLAWIVSIMLAFSGLMKIIGIDQFKEMFAFWGISSFMIPIGTLELLIAILFIIPRTASFATFLASAFLGGAIVTHLLFPPATFALAPAIILVIVLISARLRNPNIFVSE